MVGVLVQVEARLAYTGKTSMNIAVEVHAGDMKIGQMEKITACVVVFVAVEPDGKTIPVKAWQLETPSDMALAENVKSHLDLARASLPAA